MSWLTGILAHSWAFYPTLLIVLGCSLAYAMWRGRSTTERPTTPAILALAAVVVSRVTLAGTSGVIFGVLTSFTLMNLLGYSAFVIAIDRPANRLRLRPLIVQAALLGVAAGIAYAIVAATTSATATINGTINFIAVGVTTRFIAAAFQRAWVREGRHKPLVLLGLAMITTSWVLVQLSSLIDGPNTLLAAATLDVLTAVVAFAGIVAEHARLGGRYRRQATQYREDMEAAQAELNKLNKIATDIYEDSSDLILKQKEQTRLFMRKVENLEKILQMGVTIQRPHQLEDVLQMIVELVRNNLGFDTVVLRLFNESAQCFETYAHIGVPEPDVATVSNFRIPLTQYQEMINPRQRVSKSYLIRGDSSSDQSEPDSAGVVVDSTWEDVEMLVVPLTDDHGETTGYLSVENPSGVHMAVGDVIESLELVSTLSTIAIRNARVFAELQEKNEKLEAYTEKVASLNKMKADFVATISHEFRTPLASIKAYTETLLGNAEEVDRDLLKQFLVVIDEESSRLMSTIEDILDFSHLETGTMKFDRRSCDVNVLVEDAARELAKSFDASQVALKQEVPEGPTVVWAEAELIRQLIVNLLHNAAKYTTGGGSASIRIIDDVVAVRIVVEDQGNGIPESQLGKIFEQFHQVDGSGGDDEGGAGLGLAICKNIVDWHDGRIWAENVPGSGARFVAVIPKKQVLVKCHSKDVCSSVRKFEIERFLELMVETVAELVQARRASIMIVDPPGELRIAGAIGIDEDIVRKACVKAGEGISGRVMADRQSWLVTDIESDPRTERANNAVAYDSNSFISVPMHQDGKAVGVINVSCPAGGRVFDEDDCALLEQLAGRLTRAIGKLRHFAYASLDYEDVRDALRAVLDSRRFIDRQGDHQLRDIVIRAATKLGMNADEVARLRFILSVYDLGISKIGHNIVKKPGDLSPRERSEMRRHVELGADLLDALEPDAAVRDIILHHHENYDGSGYPDGMKGEEIPMESRIIRVADSLRALISQRPYQRQYSIEEAKDVVKHRAGSHFDPKVVDCFARALDEHRDRDDVSAEDPEEAIESTPSNNT